MPALTSLAREHVAARLDEPRTAGNKPETIQTRYGGASAFYNWLIREADDGVNDSPSPI